ncbi:MAG: hypothetical protein DDT21_00347 [Syntrophomonadaceae bacterium]|nr:hypothetical protein [Bacillota bacterium]
MTGQELLNKLTQAGCRVTLTGEQIKVSGPLTDKLRALIRRHKTEVVQYLKAAGTGATTMVKDKVIQLQPWRTTCQESGFCRRFSLESDCMLYPVRPGWCRERVRA